MELPGSPSDQVEGILATGRGDVGMVFVSLSARHPEGRDVDYLVWHSLDHRPEQHRLPQVRGSLRLVSTPDCRAARAASDERFDATDHVMTYFFTDTSGLPGFADLAIALRAAGRMSIALPPVQRGIYDVRAVAADPSAKVGADVLPWWPSTGVYLLVEPSASDVDELLDVPGIAGAWSLVASGDHPDLADAAAGQQVTYLFLDDEPVAVAERLRPVLEQRWQTSGTRALLAAPFQLVMPRDWTRHLP